MLRDIPKLPDPNLLIGFDTSDDACVYKITDDVAIVQTVDFFPPMVDDPFLFGQIAAANALSDIYAMGGRPTHAMNLLCFPNCLGLEVAGEILAGGADKAIEAGCSIAGGHSITDNEPKYGLCVNGVVDPRHILANSSAREGDALTIDEVKKATKVAIAAGADFVKTSTGFFTGGKNEGATYEVIEAMMEAADGRCKIKGAGGIRDREKFLKLIDMGIDRMGIGYKSTPIVLGLK